MRPTGHPRSDRAVGRGASGRSAETSIGGERGAVRERGRLALLLAVSTLLLSFDLGRWVLATNDETRFPMLARDILAQGHWWLPRLNGVAHLNKPPLYAWLIAIAAWPTGAVTPGRTARASDEGCAASWYTRLVAGTGRDAKPHSSGRNFGPSIEMRTREPARKTWPNGKISMRIGVGVPGVRNS